MLNYLLTHPELSFSPPETADLCEAFDMAVAELRERGNAAQWESDEGRATLAAEIVKARLAGVREPAELRDHALHFAKAAEPAPEEPSKPSST